MTTRTVLPDNFLLLGGIKKLRGITCFQDLAGQQFGRLSVLFRAPNIAGRRTAWTCLCECGKILTTCAESLKNGRTKSCGCLQREKARRPKNIKHGETKGGKLSTEYIAWMGMKARCSNPNNPSYENCYTSRGIKVCERWRTSFADFLSDMGRKPFWADSIDRINNDGDYEPGNCRWATCKMQANNRRPPRARSK